MSQQQETEGKTEISAEERAASSAKAMQAAQMLTHADEQTEAALAPFASAKSFAVALRMADNLADSNFVPEKFRGKPADLVFGMDIAHRTGMGLLPVLQSVFFVGGKPGFEAKFLIACLNATRRFSAIDYEEGGEGDAQYCVAFATDLKTNKVKRGTKITIALAKAEGWYTRSGSKWKTMPDQMLRYRAASFFIRAFAPDVALGMQTVDELQESVQATLEPIPEERSKPEDFGVKAKSDAKPRSTKPAAIEQKPAEAAQASTDVEKTAQAQPERRTKVVDGATVDLDTGEIVSDPKADKPAASTSDALDRAKAAQAELDAARAAADQREQDAARAKRQQQERDELAQRQQAEREQLEAAERRREAANAAQEQQPAPAAAPAGQPLTDGMRSMVQRKVDAAGTTMDALIARMGSDIHRGNVNDAFALLENWNRTDPA